jgi:uncharacterized protein YkwD
MKTRYQIAILICICLALYLVRDDVATVYNRATSYLSDKDITKESILIKADKVASMLQQANTPGALKVTEGLTSTTKVKLSVKDVISWTNKNRASNGNLAPLLENSKLNQSAQMKVDDMFKHQYFEHISPNGKGVSDIAKDVSYEYIVIGENLALGNFKDSQALLDAWMASPGHRANILNSRYTEIGVAVGHGKFKGEDTWLAVQHFGLPRSACPSVDEVLHGVITLNQKDIKAMEEDLTIRQQRIESRAVYEGKTTNEQISDYNSLVAKYNQLILDLKQKISNYNNTVRAFNDCLSSKNT